MRTGQDTLWHNHSLAPPAAASGRHRTGRSHHIGPACVRSPPRDWAKKDTAATAGNRTRINCLEGNYANHYTTVASQTAPYCHNASHPLPSTAGWRQPFSPRTGWRSAHRGVHVSNPESSELPRPGRLQEPPESVHSPPARAIPWCSGYHVCFTRRRSPVRSRAESGLLTARGGAAASSWQTTSGVREWCRPSGRPPHRRLRGATVARLTPDQKVACSNHVGVSALRFGALSLPHFLLADREEQSPRPP